jgi:outer membrane protein OmpA-like peptidoglycan-associated protein
MAQLPELAPPPPLSGLYVGAGAGVNWLQPEHLINPQTGNAANGHLVAQTGFVALGNVGYALPSGLRFEIEGNYRSNKWNHASGLGFPGGAGGYEVKDAVMFNALYDFSALIPVPWFAPYAGVGVGYGWARESSLRFYNNVTGFPRFQLGGTEGAIAYQAIVGGAFNIPYVRGLAMTVEYRFFGMGSRSYNSLVFPTATTSISPKVKLGNDFNNAILVGLRYNIGAPPPPPPPAPAPVPAQAPSRSYLVFFDWDKATLTDRARQIIREAADNSTRVQYTRIEVNGYTDTSGTPRYNQGLLIRRARAVQSELVADGVPQNAITIQGFGDTHLLVPTGPGVREPQNRRVEIIIR